MTQLVWFRRDLRVDDNPALANACNSGQSVSAVFVLSETTWRRHHMGKPQQVFLKQALASLHQRLAKLGITLTVLEAPYFSDCADCLRQFIQQQSISDLHCNREYPWDERRRDHQVAQMCADEGVSWHNYDDQCLVPPEVLRTQQGKIYTVFTPYKKAALHHLIHQPDLMRTIECPAPVGPVVTAPIPTKLAQWQVTTAADLAWLTATEQAAQQRLFSFVTKDVNRYASQRNFPGIPGTSQLSPYFALGLLSPRQCLNALFSALGTDQIQAIVAEKEPATWLSEILWRDFYRVICWHFPRVSRGRCFKPGLDAIVWSDNDEHFQAWCDGKTGIPIVDSAMRQLRQSGWMHNRLRMICAMFLSKNLWIDWRKGEAFFAEHLVDWDFASNNGGWQWSASTGTDAAPYFRIFNPISQSQRFDPQGDFIRHYCPEIRELDNDHIHCPHQDAQHTVQYPPPLVDLKQTRQAAIDRMRALG